MTIELHILFLILIGHLMGDFFSQSRKMAEKKSTHLDWLSLHALAYTVVMGGIVMIFTGGFTVEMGMWMLVNGLLHLFTDAATSRITSHYYKKENKWAFFNTIGVDQSIHYITLVFTYQFMI